MKNRIKLFLTLLVFIFVVSACSLPRLVPRTTPAPDDQNLIPGETNMPGDKTPISEGQKLDTFTKIDIQAGGPIFLIQGDSHSIQIEGRRDIVKDITYQVKNGVLMVRYSRDVWGWFSAFDYPTITIHFKDLEQFTLEGGSEVVANDVQSENLRMDFRGGASLEMKNLKADSLDLQVEGGANINIDGVVETQTLRFAGGTNYDGEDLQSATVNLHTEGAVSVTVWVTDALDLDLSGVYNVQYYGNPAITQNVQGAGNIERLGDK